MWRVEKGVGWAWEKASTGGGWGRGRKRLGTSVGGRITKPGVGGVGGPFQEEEALKAVCCRA